MSNSHLVMGGNQVDRETVRAVVTPQPEGKWNPIPHSQEVVEGGQPVGLVEIAEAGLIAAGFTIESEGHILGRNGQRYFGGFALTRDDMAGDSRKIVFGMRNTHDKSYGASFCIGTHMIVCSNLCFSSEHVITRKNTLNILRDLPFKTSQIISQLVVEWTDMNARVDAYKVTTLTKEQASDLFVDLALEGAIPESKVMRCFKLWRNPEIAAKSIVLSQQQEFSSEAELDELVEQKEFELRAEFGSGVSLWGAYNAVTEMLKTGNAHELPSRTMRMQKCMDTIAGIQRHVSSGNINEDDGADDNEEFQETFGNSPFDDSIEYHESIA